MSYENARRSFSDNCQIIGHDPAVNPLAWNLNNGLHELSRAVEKDLRDIQELLRQVVAASRQS